MIDLIGCHQWPPQVRLLDGLPNALLERAERKKALEARQRSAARSQVSVHVHSIRTASAHTHALLDWLIDEWVD